MKKACTRIIYLHASFQYHALCVLDYHFMI